MFRYATEQDAEAVHALILAAFAEYMGTIAVVPRALLDTLDDVRKALADGRTLLAFASDSAQSNGQIDNRSVRLVGTARYEPREGYLYIGRVAVHPDYRRRGVGVALMQQMEQVASRLGYTRLHLVTRGSMPGNLAFYERLGYLVVKTEPNPRGPDTNVTFEKDLS